ncbi:MAG TPA: hypothetical protein HA258_02925 [Thermoplasmata archaeon]|jgi:hypothetical protein|nr:hypothetical protein [Thermoplasmata archaeon]
MRKKILGIVMCTLVLTMIPVAAGMTIDNDPQPSKIGWTTLQGFIFRLREINGGALIGFRCLFVHYVGQGLGQRVTGIRYGGQEMVIPKSFRGILMPHIIMGWCFGVLEF